MQTPILRRALQCPWGITIELLETADKDEKHEYGTNFKDLLNAFK
jgi:hypothetical protein